MVPLHYLPVQDGLDRVTLGKEQLFMTTSFLRTQYNLTLDLVATYPSPSQVGGATKRSAGIQKIILAKNGQKDMFWILFNRSKLSFSVFK